MSQAEDKYLASLRRRYVKASKKERGEILDEYVKTTGYHRKHASAVLAGKRKRVKGPIRRPRRGRYTVEDARALEKLTELFEGINAKLLRVAMDNELKGLYESGFLKISPDCYERLKHISPATIDRLRARYGRQSRSKSTRRTKPGTLLKSQVPIRTWAEWNEDRPGFVEMDLVSHEGGNARDEHAWTLTFTDIKTGWTECGVTRNKAQTHVFEAIRRVQDRLPFPLMGVDSDNGAEFINDELIRYCEAEHLTFTRSRPGHKNDSAHVEQKNWAVVRRFVGNLRYDTPTQFKLLEALYECLHFYINFFLPVVKLKDKVRTGSKVRRSYDRPQTSYARVLASPAVSAKDKAKLRRIYKQLNLVEIKHHIDELVEQLWRSATRV